MSPLTIQGGGLSPTARKTIKNLKLGSLTDSRANEEMTDVLASQHSQSNVDGVSPKNSAMIMNVPRYHFSHSPPGSMQSSGINLVKNANSNLNKIAHNHDEPKSP